MVTNPHRWSLTSEPTANEHEQTAGEITLLGAGVVLIVFGIDRGELIPRFAKLIPHNVQKAWSPKFVDLVEMSAILLNPRSLVASGNYFRVVARRALKEDRNDSHR